MQRQYGPPSVSGAPVEGNTRLGRGIRVTKPQEKTINAAALFGSCRIRRLIICRIQAGFAAQVNGSGTLGGAGGPPQGLRHFYSWNYGPLPFVQHKPPGNYMRATMHQLLA